MSQAIDRLIGIMAKLRSPEGCPWDRKQTYKSLAPDTLEEAYEVVETLENEDMAGLREELGDLLLQVVFYAQMAREDGLFDFEAVAHGVADKMIERHPHVFADRSGVDTAESVLTHWESDKAAKREEKAAKENRTSSVLDGLSAALPASTRALKLSKRLARVGFDWPRPEDVLAKLREETLELEAEIAANAPKDKIEDELGDTLFALVNVARRYDIDPESALRRCMRKVESRFRTIETLLAEKGQKPEQASLEEMEALWRHAKDLERGAA